MKQQQRRRPVLSEDHGHPAHCEASWSPGRSERSNLHRSEANVGKGATHQYFSAFDNQKEASGSTQAPLCRYSHPDLCCWLKLRAMPATGLTRRTEPHGAAVCRRSYRNRCFECENSAKRFDALLKSRNKAERRGVFV